MSSSLYALTYNLSFASQKDEVVGSEADFVRECRARDRRCYDALIDGLSKLPERIAVAGFQEVVVDEEVQFAKLRRVLPALDQEYVATVWVEAAAALVSCMLRWNSSVLGHMRWSTTFDLDVGRPVGMVVTQTEGGRQFLLVVCHFPWLTDKRTLADVEKAIASHMPPSRILGSDAHPIVMADTNDAATLLHAERPLRLGRTWRVHQGKTRSQLRAMLKTCCWHEKGHRYGHMTDTGDYVLSIGVEQQYVPRHFAKHRDEAFASDHLPVVARIRV